MKNAQFKIYFINCFPVKYLGFTKWNEIIDILLHYNTTWIHFIIIWCIIITLKNIGITEKRAIKEFINVNQCNNFGKFFGAYIIVFFNSI